MAEDAKKHGDLLEEAQRQMLTQIAASKNAAAILKYAEAYAWLRAPAQPHGNAES